MAKKKQAGRPLSGELELRHKIDLRLTDEMNEKIEERRKVREIVPPKADMIRHLIKRGIEADEAECAEQSS